MDAALAALFAARRGLEVTLAPRPRSLALAPVTFELLRGSCTELARGDLALPRATARLGAAHRTLFPGAGALESACAAAGAELREILAGAGLPLEGEIHELRIGLTDVGTTTVVGLAPAGVAAFVELPRELEVVHCPADASFDGRLAARSFTELAGIAASVAILEMDGPVVSSAIEATRLPWREGRAAPARPDVPRAGAPRGIAAPALEGCLELLPMLEPSPLSLRLAAAIERALAAAGVRIEDGAVASIEARDDGVALVLDRSGAPVTIEAPVGIYAPGKFVSGGLASSPVLRAAALDVPVTLGGRREERMDGERHFARTFLGSHDAFRMGIAVDAGLRPLGEHGPLSDRLLAAGTVIGGVDAIAQGSGFSLLTARMAADRAASL